MSNFTRNRRLNDSGVPWVGQIPNGWQLLPAKAVFKERKSASRPGEVHLTPSQQHGVLPQAEYMARTGTRVVLNLTGADAMRHVEPGDFISHLRSFQGGLEHSKFAGKVSAAYTVLQARRDIHPDFFRYLLKSARYIQALQTTTEQLRDGQSIRFAQLAMLPLPFPPITEQRAIAGFLDRETGEIDDFIRDQEELITLLQERRTACIGHAVTRGISRAATLVETGVAWLGRIPKNWQLIPAKAVFLERRESALEEDVHLTPSQKFGVLPQIEYMQRTGNRVVMRLSEIGHMKHVEAGDYVSHLRSFQGGLELSEVRGKVSSAYTIIKPRRELDVDYFRYLFKSPAYIQGLQTTTDQLRDGQSIGYRQLSLLPLPFPDPIEQRVIAVRVRDETREIDGTIAEAQHAIALSRERRTALISEAVTGKIDVREHGGV